MSTRTCPVRRLLLGLLLPVALLTTQASPAPIAQDGARAAAPPAPASLEALALCDTVAQIPKAECLALVDLYDATGGPAWTTRTNWLATNTPCSWYGVTCTGANVTRVALSSNHLVGALPSTLSNLASLRALDVSANQVSGSIPSTLGSLPALEELWLDRNVLTGGIPSSLGSLPNLTKLWLATNQLSGSIPASLGSLAKLEFLVLADNLLTGSIPPELGSLSHLVNLALSENALTGSIPSSLGSLTNLMWLMLDQNQLSGSIPSTLGSLSNVKWFYLDHNQLSGSIPSTLGSLSSVGWFHLHDNQLTGSIPSTLGNLSPVTLILSNNQLTGGLPSSLGNIGSLAALAVDGNPLSGALPASLTNLSLNAFAFDNTDLCEPPDAAFQAWLAGIATLRRTGVLCSAPTATPTRTSVATLTHTSVATLTRTPSRTATRLAAARAYLPLLCGQRSLPASTPTHTRVATLTCTPTATATPVDLIFLDDFNDGDLAGWTAHGGVWTNPATSMRGQDTETPVHVIRNMRSATGGSFVYEGTVNLLSGYSVGLDLRSSADGALGYEVALSSLDNQFKLGVLSPGFGQLAYAPVAIEFGRAYRIKVVANGSLIEGYLDGVKLLSATDTQYSSGQFGVVVRGGWYTQQGIAHFDDLEARALP